MKLLLMVERGGKVVCAKSFGLGWRTRAHAYFVKLTQRMDSGEPGQPDRAWLVEAESADEARRLIGCVDQDGEPLEARSNGRILACGGKEEAVTEDRDLTPAATPYAAPYGASEARAEIEAFFGEGWMCDGALHHDGDAIVWAQRPGCHQYGIAPTYRAAVDALLKAWRDAVRPWCVKSAQETYNATDRDGDLYPDTPESIVARVLKEDQ